MFMFVCLINKSNSNLSLDLTIKQTKLKHNNVFVIKLVKMRHYITIYNIIFYMCTKKKYLYRIEIELYKFINLILWSQRIWQPRPISYQAQGLRRGGRNVRGRTKKVQIARRHCRGQSCSRQTEITEGESGTPPRAVS